MLLGYNLTANKRNTLNEVQVTSHCSLFTSLSLQKVVWKRTLPSILSYWRTGCTGKTVSIKTQYSRNKEMWEEQQPPRNFPSPLLSSKQTPPSPQYITSPSASCTHTFPWCRCLPEPLSHISHRLSPARFIFSRIFLYWHFLYLHIRSASTSSLLRKPI